MLRFFIFVIFGTIVGLTSAEMLAKTQSIAVKGIVKCDEEVPKNVKIQLWDVDRTDPDDLIIEGTLDENGGFFLEGSETEFSTIDPELRIIHKCGNDAVECFRQTIIDIPDEFISDGETPTKTYDTGNINLRVIPNTETNKCYWSN
uniref:Uncharacterized protein n=1 Tax=Panagrolaimus sp. PS1159 TaxID=55785 RepID=A0AC35FE41_9BILA